MFNLLKSRNIIIATIVITMFVALGIRLFNLQIVNSDNYLNNYMQKTEKERFQVGTRASIYDREGNVLAYNELTYAITIEDTLDSSNTKSDELNFIIKSLVDIIEKNNDALLNDFPIVYNQNNDLIFSTGITENTRLRFLKNIYGTEVLDTEKEQISTYSAQEVFTYLKDTRYEISNEYSDEQCLKIMMVRYSLSLNAYKKYISTTIATNVSNETVAAIYENKDILKGVSVKEETVRRYNNSLYLAHIIGYTGKISEEQLVELNTAGGNYFIDDVVGKSGIEYTFESTLSGDKGSERVIVDTLGKVISVLDKKEATAGDDIYLTIDTDLQIATYHALEKNISEVLLDYIVNSDATIDGKKNVLIPIKDVYFQLINNNLIDITALNNENSSNTEKKVYEKFVNRQEAVIGVLNSQILGNENIIMKDLPKEFQEYYDYIFEKLSNKDYNIIDNSLVDKNDEMYKKWLENQVSFKDFLKYTIKMSWINPTYLTSDTKYSDSEKIYESIYNYIISSIKNDINFNKIVYKYLVKNMSISGNELCVILYDQLVLQYNETEYNKLLSNGAGYAYEFMMNQIRTLSITPAQLALKPCAGSAVVTDVNTGEVLALVSYPSYDNNIFSGSIDEDYWRQLNNDLSIPLYNRATKTRMAPGSTFKMLTATAGLEEGVVAPFDTINCAGIFTKVTPSPKCWAYPGAHGAVNSYRALEQSCNSYFYEVGYRLASVNGTFDHDTGVATLRKYGEMFGLTTESGVEIDESQPQFSTENAVTSSIGQGSNSFAPVQLARYVSTIASNGKNYKLTLLDKITDSKGDVISNPSPILENEVALKASTWDVLHKGMNQVITKGSVRTLFANYPIQLAGKTGTAQENLAEASHGLFVSYAPFNEPEISVVAAIQNGYTSFNAAKVVKDVISFYFGYSTLEEIMS